MAQIQWKDRYNIGYKDIDAQHRVLLDLLNELIDLIDQKKSPEGIADIFRGLCAYALTHFTQEERYMRAAGYPGLARQEAEHARFVDQVLAFNQAYDPSDPRLLNETRTFLREWYLDHILKSDMDYVSCLKRYHGEAAIRAVIFDFGNVLCRFDNDRFLAGLAALCGRPAEELKVALYGGSSLTQDYEAGRIGSAEFLAGLSALCGRDLPEAEVLHSYTDIFEPIKATFDLVRKLKPGYKLGLLSNTSPWHFEHAIRTTEVFPLFDEVTLSFEVGASKPDPRLFEDALAKLDLMAEECVYIDDLPAFAQAATKHLMHGIAYTTPIALMAQLRQLGVQF
jgi:HAD superfamily hydrolase (TIGR01509 family)